MSFLTCWLTDPTIEVVSPIQDITVDEDGPAEFICQFSRPVHAIWKKNDQEIHADGQRVIIDQDWNVSMLKINPTVPEDTGIYSCEAEGTKVMATLDVQGEVFQPERKTLPWVPNKRGRKIMARLCNKGHIGYLLLVFTPVLKKRIKVVGR